MLGVVRRSRGVSMPPLREDLVLTGLLPVGEAAEWASIDTRFLGELTQRRRHQCLAGFLASGDRLPVIGKIRALQQEHLEIIRVYEYQHRDRDLVTAYPVHGRVRGSGAVVRSRHQGIAHARKIQRGLCRVFQYSMDSAKISDSISQSAGWAFLNTSALRR